MQRPGIGVIVLNWNGYDDTVVCLESLAGADPPPARVVVVDNGSSEDGRARLKAYLATRGVPLVAAPENLGFAGGNNLGLRYLRDDSRLTHFMLLNNDATVAPDFFRRIADALQRHPGAGLLSGTIYHASQPHQVWYAGGRLTLWRAVARHQRRPPHNSDPTITEFVTGCAMVISRPLLERAGELADCYFPGYMEDVEYSYRARQAGFAALYVPDARVYHAVGATFEITASPEQRAFTFHRHRAWFVRRNLHGWTRYAAIGFLTFGKLGHAVLETVSGRPRRGWAMLRGVASGFFTPA